MHHLRTFPKSILILNIEKSELKNLIFKQMRKITHYLQSKRYLLFASMRNLIQINHVVQKL